VFAVLVTWWLESRFGSLVAVAAWGCLVGMIVFAGGALFAHRLSARTLENAVGFVDGLMQAQRNQMLVMREDARGEREAFNARVRLDVIDARRVDRLAQQRAGLLLEVERERIQREQAAPVWAEDDSAEYREVE
jgi:hypothetical protein